MLRRLIILTICVCLCLSCALPAHAQTARDITAAIVFSGGGFEDYSFLTDENETEYQYTEDALTLSCDSGIGGIFLVFDQIAPFEIREPRSGKTVTRDSRYLHEYADLQELSAEAPTEITLHFPQGASLCEIRVYSPGPVPDTVQRWSDPLEGGADMVLFSTHGDDEQLYFAGLLPEYAGQRQLDVQVVYMTGHDNICGSERKHEMLNGLWAVGVRAYPVFGPFPDFKLPDREETYTEYENLGFSRADLLRFMVRCLRRFRPQVAIGHDLLGEYGHGMHMVYADLLTQAVAISADSGVFPDQIPLYGTWDVPKTYLHLYPENPITMNYDRPLDAFGGLTAFQATQQLGFPCHKSQQYTLYTHWLYGEEGQIHSAADIEQWSPCEFGLFRTTVGNDVEKNDFMEHITPYALQVQEEEPSAQTMQSLPSPTVPAEPAPTLPETTLPPVETHSYLPLALAGMVLSGAAFVYLILRKKFFEKK